MVFVPSVPHCPLKEAGQRPEQAEDTGQGSPTQAAWKQTDNLHPEVQD